MEGVLEGRELAWRRAARGADLVPTIGAAVGLVMAGSWTGSGNEVGGRRPRPEDEATQPCERLADGLRGLARAVLEPRSAARRVLRGAAQPSLEKPTVATGSPRPPVAIQTRPSRGTMTRRSRFLASVGTVVSHKVGHSRAGYR